MSIVSTIPSSILKETLLPLDRLLFTRDLGRTALPPVAGDEWASGESGGNVPLDRPGSQEYEYGCGWCVGVEYIEPKALE